MAITSVNLTDPVTNIVTGVNTLGTDLGDRATLFDNSLNLVQAINEINVKVANTDSANVISLVQANSMDSGEVINLLARDSAQTSLLSNFIKDSARGIGLDSSTGKFFLVAGGIDSGNLKPGIINAAKITNLTIPNGKIANNTLTSSKFSSAVTLLIKDSAGTTLKTIRSPGS